MFRPFACAALAFATALTFAASASAAPGDTTTVTRAVRFTDADLHTADGAKRSALRIKNAAAYVCGGDNMLDRQGSGYIACHKAAVDRALAQLDAPMVSAELGRTTTTSFAQR